MENCRRGNSSKTRMSISGSNQRVKYREGFIYSRLDLLHNGIELYETYANMLYLVQATVQTQSLDFSVRIFPRQRQNISTYVFHKSFRELENISKKSILFIFKINPYIDSREAAVFLCFDCNISMPHRLYYNFCTHKLLSS